MLVDFDGTLAPIVDDPDAARPDPRARAALARCAARVARVAVVSGRPVAFLRDHLALEGVVYVGQYGLERAAGDTVRTDPRVAPHVPTVARTAAAAEVALPGIRVERKGTVAIALHWREHPELEARALDWARATATESGLVLHPGRSVVELRPPVPVDKGSAVAELATGMRSALFAGDDRGDLAAFVALDRLVAGGSLDAGVKVAVRSPEEPPELVERADLQVDGPAGVADLLERVADEVPLSG